MIERAARGIFRGYVGGTDDAAWNKMPEDIRDFYRRLARSTIEAMREPTEEMCEAGFEHTGHPCWPKDVGKAWQAMIDAILADKP